MCVVIWVPWMIESVTGMVISLRLNDLDFGEFKLDKLVYGRDQDITRHYKQRLFALFNVGSGE